MKSNQPEAYARAPRGAAHVDAARASIARRARATTMDPAEPNAGTNAGARVGGGSAAAPLRLKFTLKRPATTTSESAKTTRAEGGRGENESRVKRARSESGSGEDARIAELRAKMARLEELVRDGGERGAGGEARSSGGGTTVGRERIGHAGLSRGVAPRAAFFEQMVMGGANARDEGEQPSTSARGGEEDSRTDGAPVVGGQNVSMDPPTVKDEPAASKKKLDDALNKLQKLDKTHVFAYPVTEEIAPGYFSIITRPMDFSTLRANVKNGHYAAFYPFCVDVETMFRNALRYNPPVTEIHQLAANMLEKARRMLNKLRGLAPSAGFIKPAKIKTASEATKSTRVASTATLSVPMDVDMFSPGAASQLAEDDDGSNYLNVERDFDVGLESFLDGAFQMTNMAFDAGMDAFDMHHGATSDGAFVSKPQEMTPKATAATKRQTFKIPLTSHHIMRLPEIFLGYRTESILTKQRLRKNGNIFVSSSGSATLDMYSASVRSFLSAVDKDKWDNILTEKWKKSAAPPDPEMMDAPEVTTFQSTPLASQASELPASTGTQLPASNVAPAILQPSLEDSISLLTLVRENPDDHMHPPRIKAGIAGMRAMLRAGDVLRGDAEPEDENPLDKLPPGVIPTGRDMVFTVTVIGNTIAHSLRKRNIDVRLPQAPAR